MRKVSIVFVICIFAVSCLGGCKPTPEKEAVVNKAESMVSEYVAKPTELPDDGAVSSFEPAKYKTIEHWKERIEKNQYFIVEADADVQMPENETYRIDKLERFDLTQEWLNKLVNRFAAGKKFYKDPPLLKEDFERELIHLRKSLNDVLNGADGENPESIRTYIKEVEKKHKNAPEKAEREYIEPKYTFSFDYETGKPMKDSGENFFNARVENADGSDSGAIYASKLDSNKSSSSFYYNDCEYYSESMVVDQLKWLKEDEQRMNEYKDVKNPYPEEDAKRIKTQLEFFTAMQERMKTNKLDLDAAKAQAIALFEEMGIEGVQIFKCEKALSEPADFNKSLYYGEYKPTVPENDACSIEFTRECGGIPNAVNYGGTSIPKNKLQDGMYYPPFYPEQGNIIIDANGIRQFNWYGMANKVETFAENAKVLPFSEIKQRAVDQLYFMNTYYDTDGNSFESRKEKLRFEIKDVKLCMTYIGAKDDIDRALVVPAWVFTTQSYFTFNDPTNPKAVPKESLGNEEKIFINALDGAPIVQFVHDEGEGA